MGSTKEIKPMRGGTKMYKLAALPYIGRIRRSKSSHTGVPSSLGGKRRMFSRCRTRPVTIFLPKVWSK